MEYYIRLRGQQQGPFTGDQLQKLSARGRFSRHYEVSTDCIVWQRADAYTELFPPPAGPRRNEPVADPIQASAILQPEQPKLNENQLPEEWFYTRQGAELGPVTAVEIKRLIGLAEVVAEDHVWTDGMVTWQRVRDVPELSRQLSGLALPPAGAAQDSAEMSGLAITSFILGLLGASILFFLASVPAIAFGHVALAQIRRSPRKLGGQGLAVAGLVFGYVVVVPTIITAIVYAAITAPAPREFSAPATGFLPIWLI